MKTLHLNGLVERVADGDLEAADRLNRMLETVVTRRVRRVLENRESGTPMAQRVHGLLHAAEAAPAEGLERTTVRITQAICGQTVARLQSHQGPAQHAAETVWS